MSDVVEVFYRRSSRSPRFGPLPNRKVDGSEPPRYQPAYLILRVASLLASHLAIFPDADLFASQFAALQGAHDFVRPFGWNLDQ